MNGRLFHKGMKVAGSGGARISKALFILKTGDIRPFHTLWESRFFLNYSSNLAD